jgi:rod shape-determining protein MreD
VTLTPGFFIRSAVLFVSALVLQGAVFDRHVVAGVPIDIFLVAAVAGGLAGGAQRGAVTGFVAGLGADVLLQTPFGLSSLSLAVVGYMVGSVSATRTRQSRVFPVLAGLVGGALGVLVFAVFGELVGQPYLSDPDLVRIVAVRAVSTAVLVLPVQALLRWAWRPPIPSSGRMVIA